MFYRLREGKSESKNNSARSANMANMFSACCRWAIAVVEIVSLKYQTEG